MKSQKTIKVGSLVEVVPTDFCVETYAGMYIVVYDGDPDPLLEDCPVLYSLDKGTMAPMNRKFIKVLSE
tara:strand:+ start:3074 stop:3280 length:207 start_codon:yes stop_codon:yes gene_type:complete